MTMEAVDKRWYIGYTWWIVINAIIVIAVSVASIFIPFIGDHLYTWSLTAPTTISLAVLVLLYRVTLYNRQSRMFGLNFATFVISLIQIANVINLLNLTGWASSWYLILLYIMLFMSGIVGVFPLIGAALLNTLYILITFPSIDPSDNLLQQGLVLGASYAMCGVSLLAWKGQYIDEESQRVNRLNSMLKNKQQESEILIRSIADGVIVTDTVGRISLMNPSASVMTQWPVQEADNIDVRTVLKLAQENGQPLQLKEDLFTQVFSKRKNFNQVVSLIGRDGKKQIVSLIVSPVILPTTKELFGAVSVMRDISAERKVEQQRADFISTASHEMRTPVAAIEGYLALAMNENVSKIDAHAKEYLDKAHASTQHLGQLFQDLLTSAKAEDGRLSNYPIVTDMKAFIEGLVEDLRVVAHKKGLEMDLIVSNREGSGVIDTSGSTAKVIQPIYYALVDPDRVREVITNLFDNAVKYTEKGKVTMSIAGNKDVVQLRISDTGAGIPAEDLPHLFQKFYRVDNSSTRSVGGTGLGLFICKKIVELYGGIIWAESTLGKGSTFYINLPRLTSERAAQLKQREKPKGQINI